MTFTTQLRSLLTEDAGHDTIVLSFGRFNPPHRGHKLLTDLLISTAQRLHGDAALWVKGRVGPKDPLSVADKARYLKMLTPGLAVRYEANLPDPADVIQSYSDHGYRHLVLVLGGDRTDKLTQDIKAEMAAGRLHFDSFKVLSAGDRSGSEMWSATEQRAAAQADDFDAFAAGLPAHFPAAREMFNNVRKGLGLTEDFSALMTLARGRYTFLVTTRHRVTGKQDTSTVKASSPREARTAVPSILEILNIEMV